jgi:hypothetical protein
MTGDRQNAGRESRCFDVIFNSIGGHQAKKIVFKLNIKNGFEIQSDANAPKDSKKVTYCVTALKTPKKEGT